MKPAPCPSPEKRKKKNTHNSLMIEVPDHVEIYLNVILDNR